MKEKAKVLIFFIFSITLSQAQSIQINPAGSAESSLDAFDLTEQVLIDGGECSSISNFTLKENPQRPFPNADRSWGYFEKGSSDFPFERGIILTSGYARRANGPTKGWQNLSDGGSSGWPGDADASVLADISTKNATVFEFDFVPFGNEISFNYIFASSEYPDFSCSQSFNDVFGFIISGPGITPDPGLSGKNIALLPNGDWVTVRNVNDGPCGDDTYYVAGPFQDIAHGGRTVPLTAYAEVVPFETYHIRLLVSDAYDHQADSAVFLEAGSFSLGTMLIDIHGDEIGDQVLQCDETEFTMSSNLEIPEAAYQWYFNGDPIPGATDPEYTATESGTYMLEVFAGGCSDQTEVEVIFSTTPEIKDYEPFEQCTSTGSYLFDLTEFYEDITDTAGAVFFFYYTEEGATSGELGDIITDIQNFPVTGTITIWVKVQSAEGCFIIVPLTLIVETGPDTNAAEQRFCNFQGENTHVFDLTDSENDLVPSDPAALTFEYYLDEAMTQQITDPENFTNTSNPQIIYVKVFDPLEEEGCISEEELTLQVDPFPILQPDEIVVCDNLNDGTETVDLTSNNIVVTPGIAVVYQYLDADGNLIADPENYTVNSSPETITVRIRTEDENCEEEEFLTIVFMPAPELNNAELEECSQDGQAIFHLPEADELVTDDPTESIIGYFLTFDDAQNNSNPLPLDYTNEFPGQIVYIRVENENGCYNIAEILLTINEGPDSQPYSEAICDDNGDGFMEFNLTELAPNMLPGGTADIEIHYYLDSELTEEIENPEGFINTVNPQTVYLSFVDTTLGEEACVSTNELLLKVDEFPEIQSDEILICDNLNDGTEIIDLTDNQIVITQGISVSYLYFEADGTPIGNPENYTLTDSPVKITVTVKNADGSCEDSALLTIYMQEAPEMFEETAVLVYCSLDDYATFHLPDGVPNILIGNPEDFEISFHLTFEEARNNENPLPYDYTNVSPDQIVYVRAENENGCFNIGEIQLSTVLIHKELSAALSVCDDPYLPNDGIAVFDLTERNPEIEDILEGSFEIEFFISMEDALSGNNMIPDPTEFENTENPQTIYARAIGQDGSCSGIVDFEIEVLQVPEFELPDYLAFCDYDTVKSYFFHGDFSSYQWFDPNGNTVSTSPEVIFNGAGIYTLEVRHENLDCPARREIEIIYDDAPIILDVIVDGHTVTVTSSGGEPPVTYSYDNGLTWSGGLFYDVPGGIYEMLAKSKYGCISAGRPFGVLGVSNVITPNGDGRNDFWEIRGVAAFPEANIKIFDRFGKKFVDRSLTTDFRWDGKYLGNPVPSGDYWYLITLEDGKKISGHISVRNQ